MNTELKNIGSPLPATGATHANRLNALKARAQNQAGIMWTPREGDTLAGEIIGHEKTSGLYGDGYLMLVRDEHGQTVKVWLTQCLKNNLRLQHAERGDLIVDARTYKTKCAHLSAKSCPQ